MKFPDWLPVFGDQSFRGNCPKEDSDLISFISWLEWTHKDYFALFIHQKNEGKRTWQQVAADKRKRSINKGVSDVVIPVQLPLVMEVKRKDHTKSGWEDGQLIYLETAKKHGAFVCAALGFEGQIEAFNYWLKLKGKL